MKVGSGTVKNGTGEDDNKMRMLHSKQNQQPITNHPTTIGLEMPLKKEVGLPVKGTDKETEIVHRGRYT